MNGFLKNDFFFYRSSSTLGSAVSTPRSRAEFAAFKAEDKSGSSGLSNAIDVQSIINERRPSNLRGSNTSSPNSHSYSHIYVKSGSDAEEDSSKSNSNHEVIEDEGDAENET